MKRCKITVLRRCFFEDFSSEYSSAEITEPCPFFKEGDTYITSGPFGCGQPEGFCDMAWHAIELQATSLATGGKVFGLDNFNIACCNDGIRPVVFRLEEYEDDSLPVR